MESLYLLLPLSVLLVLAIIGVFAWALNAGQFDDLEREGWRVLEQGEGADAPAAATEPAPPTASPAPAPERTPGPPPAP